jgi:hypothetical protein
VQAALDVQKGRFSSDYPSLLAAVEAYKVSNDGASGFSFLLFWLFCVFFSLCPFRLARICSVFGVFFLDDEKKKIFPFFFFFSLLSPIHPTNRLTRVFTFQL